MSILMDNQIQHIPSQSWDELEEVKNISNNVEKDATQYKKAWLVFTLALVSVLSLPSCGSDKSVDQKVLDIIQDKQEQVDKLSKKESNLVLELQEVRSKKNKAERVLSKANRLKR